MTKGIQYTVTCPMCGSKDVILDPQLYVHVCRTCGLVIEEHPCSYGYENRVFDDKAMRTSGVETNKVHDKGIGSTEFEATYDVKDKLKWKTLERINKSVRVSKNERVVEKALRFLNQYARLLNAPNYVAETAAKLLSKTVRGKNYKSKTLKNFAIASIYVAYKIHGCKKPAKLFAKETNIKLSDLWEGTKTIELANNVKTTYVKKEDPSNYIEILVKKLNLSSRVNRLSHVILNKAKEVGIGVGKPAVGLASASVYIATILLNEKKTQLEIAEALGISDVMIRNRYSEIIDNLDITIYV